MCGSIQETITSLMLWSQTEKSILEPSTIPVKIGEVLYQTVPPSGSNMLEASAFGGCRDCTGAIRQNLTKSTVQQIKQKGLSPRRSGFRNNCSVVNQLF